MSDNPMYRPFKGLGEYGGRLDHGCIQVEASMIDIASALMTNLGYHEDYGRRKILLGEGESRFFFIPGGTPVQLWEPSGPSGIMGPDESHLAFQAEEPLQVAIDIIQWVMSLKGEHLSETEARELIYEWGDQKWAIYLAEIFTLPIEIVPIPPASFQMPARAAETTDDMAKHLRRLGAIPS